MHQTKGNDIRVLELYGTFLSAIIWIGWEDKWEMHFMYLLMFVKKGLIKMDDGNDIMLCSNRGELFIRGKKKKTADV